MTTGTAVWLLIAGVLLVYGTGKALLIRPVVVYKEAAPKGRSLRGFLRLLFIALLTMFIVWAYYQVKQ